MTAAPTALRVLVVDDSLLFQEALGTLLAADPGLEVVGVVGTAAAAVARTHALKPDILTLDLGLPDADGFSVVMQLMAERPTPILVLTATLNPAWRKEAFHALSLGALDVLQKPDAADLASPLWCRRLCERVKWLARSPVMPHLDFHRQQRQGRLEPRLAQRQRVPPSVTRPTPTRGTATVPELVIWVGSAGSPRAVASLVEQLLPYLPLRVPILIALHLGSLMAEPLAHYLRDEFDLEAQVLRAGEQLQAGRFYIAPGGCHLALNGRVASLLQELPGARYCPDLNHLLQSVANAYGPAALGIILSGMGDDGSAGMLALHTAGAVTLAQEPSSCLIDSMPQNAVRAGGIHQVLSLAAMVQRLAPLTRLP